MLFYLCENIWMQTFSPGIHSYLFWQTWRVYWDRNFPPPQQQRRRISAWSVVYVMHIALMIWSQTKPATIHGVDSPSTVCVCMSGWELCLLVGRVSTWCLESVHTAANPLQSKWWQENEKITYWKNDLKILFF